MEGAKLIGADNRGEAPLASGRIRAANGPARAGSGTARSATETPALPR